MRIALAKALFVQPTMLLLDEVIEVDFFMNPNLNSSQQTILISKQLYGWKTILANIPECLS